MQDLFPSIDTTMDMNTSTPQMQLKLVRQHQVTSGTMATDQKGLSALFTTHKFLGQYLFIVTTMESIFIRQIPWR